MQIEATALTILHHDHGHIMGLSVDCNPASENIRIFFPPLPVFLEINLNSAANYFWNRRKSSTLYLAESMGLSQ